MTCFVQDNVCKGSEMNGCRFFKSKATPTISFQNPIQIQIRQTHSYKIKLFLNPKFYQSCSAKGKIAPKQCLPHQAK